MSLTQTILLTVVGMGLFLLTFDLVRRYLLREKYAMLWFLVATFVLTIPWLFSSYNRLGRLIGIIDPISLYFFGGILFLTLLSLQFSIALTTAWGQRKILLQRVAFLEERVRELEARGESDAGGRKGVDPEGTEGASRP